MRKLLFNLCIFTTVTLLIAFSCVVSDPTEDENSDDSSSTSSGGSSISGGSSTTGGSKTTTTNKTTNITTNKTTTSTGSTSTSTSSTVNIPTGDFELPISLNLKDCNTPQLFDNNLKISLFNKDSKTANVASRLDDTSVFGTSQYISNDLPEFGGLTPWYNFYYRNRNGLQIIEDYRYGITYKEGQRSNKTQDYTLNELPTGITSYSPTSFSYYNNGLTLYFSSTKIGGAGENDIYKTTRSTLANAWEPPTNIGSIINTNKNEQSVHISADGLEMFFASDRAGGVGAENTFDIYISKRASTSAAWGTPTNAGTHINTEKDEKDPYLGDDGKTLVFYSDGWGDAAVYQSKRP